MHVPIPTLYTMNKNVCSPYLLSGLDWTGLASDPLSRTGLDQDHRLTDLGWTGLFQMNLFHTLAASPRQSAAPPPRPGGGGGGGVAGQPIPADHGRPVLTQEREDAVNVHQLRARHWGLASRV